MNIIYKNSNSNLHIKEYCKLYLRCFNQKKFQFKYLNWLYNDNPDGNFVGIDCFYNNKLIGQVGGIPHVFYWNKKKLKFIISINVCVDKNYRGQKLFSKMSNRFELLLKKSNFDGVIAIGNKLATHAWVNSINLVNLGELETFLGWGKINESNIYSKKYNFYSAWDSKKLSWRLDNPINQTYLINDDNSKIKLIYSITEYPMLKAHAPLIFSNKNIQLTKYNKNTNKLFIFIGKVGKLINKNIIHIPKKLKPSPLNFLYKSFNENINLDYDKVFFSFLDFDAF